MRRWSDCAHIHGRMNNKIDHKHIIKKAQLLFKSMNLITYKNISMAIYS